MNKKKSGIYMWTSPSGKKYIGQSTQLDIRKRNFLQKSYAYGGVKINNARKSYPNLNDWKYKVIEYCGIDELDERERYYITLYDTINNGYNSESGGNENKTLSDETKLIMSFNNSGKNNPMYGKKQTYESRLKNSEWHKNNTLGENNPMYGKKQTKESIHKNKMSQPLRKGVIQYDLSMNVIAEYDSLNDASRSIGKTKKCISLCCNGLQSSAYGFIWRYKKESD